MKKEILFEAIGEIDDELIEESELIPKKKGKILPFALAAAACLVLICVGAFRLANLGVITNFTSAETASPPENAEAVIEEDMEEAAPEELPPQAEEGKDVTGGYADGNGVYTSPNNPNIVYNHYDEVALILAESPPSFTEELNDDEFTAILPKKTYDWMDISANAVFSYWGGNLCDVNLQVTTSLNENISVTLSHYEDGGDLLVEVQPGAQQSSINGMEYQVFSHYWNDNELYLWATTKINGTYIRFEFTVHPDDEEQAKKDFEAVLECFSHYSGGAPDLNKVQPEVIPEYFNEDLTPHTATENEAFGAYVPKNGPEGFGESYFHYSKWGDVHSLTAHWNLYPAYFYIDICEFSSADVSRLVKVSDTEKYDLNLYPIPRADSVPEELWEVVNDPVFEIDDLTLEAVKLRTYYVEDIGDTDGPRMNFSVKYGDVLVNISAKGVEPEWVYECLKDLG